VHKTGKTMEEMMEGMDEDSGRGVGEPSTQSSKSLMNPCKNYATYSDTKSKKWKCSICCGDFTGTLSRVANHIMGKSIGQAPGIKACTGGPSTESRTRFVQARSDISTYVAASLCLN